MLFETFFRMLNSDERIQFTIARKGDQLSVLVQPVLQRGIGEEQTLDPTQHLRAALAMPLYVVTQPELLDRDFPHSLAEFAGMREHMQGNLKDAVMRIKEAGKQACAAKNAESDSGIDKETAKNKPAGSLGITEAGSYVEVTDKSLF